jgi:hypothetical protein
MLGFGLAAPAAFLPVPAWRVLLPTLLMVALGALLLTGLTWPFAVLARRRYGGTFPLSGRSAMAYRGVRVFSLATVMVVGGFVAVLGAISSDFSLASTKSDGALLTLQVLSLIVFGGSALVALWNLVLVWTTKRGWFAKLWSLVVALSALVVLAAALLFHLIGFNVNY